MLTTKSPDTNVTGARFAAAMAPLGPFEPAPHLAVAVSGGSDSLALLVLLRGWLAGQGGRLTVLTVDHGLRPEAADECRQVGVMVAGLNAQPVPGPAVADQPPLDHVILTWRGAKAATGLMAAARVARYHLLRDWCLQHDVLHLFVAHHADDQAETVLMRQDHGSSLFGLAGMAGLRLLDGVRLLRPLLSWSKAELQAVVRAAGLAWLEDPSNRADRFERVRWRQHLKATSDVTPVLRQAREAGQQRDRLERQAAAWLAEHGRIDPAGYISLNVSGLQKITTDLAQQILRQCMLTVTGADFAPSPAALARLVSQLCPHGQVEQGDIPTTTLGGCLLAMRAGALLLCREAADCAGPLALMPGEVAIWDRRFTVGLLSADYLDGHDPAAGELQVAALGERGLANRTLPLALAAQPPHARASLPALWRGTELLAIGGLSPVIAAEDMQGNATNRPFHRLNMSFQPSQPATSCGFTVVLPVRHTM